MKLTDVEYYRDRNFLIKSLDQLSVWTYILGYTPSPKGSLGPSPFRSDDHPGSCKMVDINGVLIFMDFATSNGKETRLDCVKAYKILNPSMGNMEVVKNLLSIGKCSNVVAHAVKKKKKSRVSIYPRNWEHRDREFWSKRHVGKDQLIFKNRVIPVSGFKINQTESLVSDLVYAYGCEEECKLYFPERKSNRFLGNMGPDSLWHRHSGSTLLVTKSHKDFLVLENIVPELSLTHLQAEGTMPSVSKIFEWECTYDRIIIWLDPDEAGKQGALKLKELIKYKPTEIVDSTSFFSEKDVDAYVVNTEYETAKTTIRQILHL